MRTLAICQIYNPILHGYCEEANGHLLAIHAFDKEYDETPTGFLNFWFPNTFNERLTLNNEMNKICKKYINKLQNSNNFDEYDIQNIPNIRELINFPKVDIVETIVLKSGHLVAIKKTIWLSIFQRMLKKRYANIINNQPTRKKICN